MTPIGRINISVECERLLAEEEEDGQPKAEILRLANGDANSML